MVAALEERGEDPVDRRMIDPTKVFARLEVLLRDVGLVRRSVDEYVVPGLLLRRLVAD